MKHTRLILGTILLLFLVSLMLYYSLNYHTHDPDVIYIPNYNTEFILTNVRIEGVVTTVNNTNHTLTIAIDPPLNTPILVTTTEDLATAHPGDMIEVYGRLTSRTHITAETLLITNQWSNILIYLRSLPAIPFALYLFFRAYRFNTTTYRFERRKPHG
jgi:hypothetical protein